MGEGGREGGRGGRGGEGRGGEGRGGEGRGGEGRGGGGGGTSRVSPTRPLQREREREGGHWCEHTSLGALPLVAIQGEWLFVLAVVSPCSIQFHFIQNPTFSTCQ